MSQETAGSNSKLQIYRKSAMNVLRRALSFRNKRSTAKQDTEDSSRTSMEMQPITSTSPNNNNKSRINSLPSSDVPSTSASCSQPRAPSVYEDPFVAVAADGTIHIKHYYNFNSRAEFHLDDIRHGHVRRNCRVIKAKDVLKVFYAAGIDCKDESLCKSWGICINNVWWASHLNRMEGANAYTNVVLVEDSMMHAGFSVINIEAFAETIQCVGLPRDSPFQNGLPNPPISMLKIPFIDDEEEDGPKKRKTRRNPSKVKRN
ncbi:SET domain-containing protein [Caenorhabditis elegans]|uniref:SET domain-containing protein n=1 Tax=Caenorhabditis elegans TaxID=6239 RepID=Q9N5P5_CAEEL|nr:SET domain-containing protein [Caenorhabditis elegans]CCD71664.1 SET domain-containing protein [Caenorhabditis elegans]|eukprot:NP_508466.2 Uncharacterized protein CELE_H01M10.1 [Caenorhabditis elegans]